MNEAQIRVIANAASGHAESTVEYYSGDKDGLDYPATMFKVRDLKFAELLIKDMLRVVAAHALSGDSAVDVFANLQRLYEVK